MSKDKANETLAQVFPIGYKIVEAGTPQELAVLVDDLMGSNTPENFWQPVGAPTFTEQNIFQSLVLWWNGDDGEEVV